MIRTLHSLVTTTSERITLLRQHHETNSPITHLELSWAGQLHKWECFASLGFQMACGVMVVTLCPRPSLTYLVNDLRVKNKKGCILSTTILSWATWHAYMLQSYLPQADHIIIGVHYACMDVHDCAMFDSKICMHALLERDSFHQSVCYITFQSKLPKIMAWDME